MLTDLFVAAVFCYSLQKHRLAYRQLDTVIKQEGIGLVSVRLSYVRVYSCYCPLFKCTVVIVTGFVLNFIVYVDTQQNGDRGEYARWCRCVSACSWRPRYLSDVLISYRLIYTQSNQQTHQLVDKHLLHFNVCVHSEPIQVDKCYT